MRHEAANPERGACVRVTHENRDREPAYAWDEAAALRAELALRLESYPGWLARGRITRAAMAAQIAAFERAIAAAESGDGGAGHG